MADTEGLFREQAIVSRMLRNDGHPRLVTPPGSALLSSLLLVTLVLVAVFLGTSHYARKTTVTGYLEMNQATKRVHVARNGTIDALFVKVGEPVKKGQALASISVATTLDRDDRAAMLAEYDSQLASIAQRIAVLHDEIHIREEQVAHRTEALQQSILHIRRMLQIQADKVDQLQQTHDAARPLFESGHLSRLEWGRFRESLLSARQQREQLESDEAQQQDELLQLGIEFKQVRSSNDSQVLALQQEASRVKQSRQSLEAEATTALHASIDGTVSTLLVQPGDSVSQREAILSITPADNELTAKLLVPSSAVGFINPGQPVNLLYDAFPYQQFGTFKGRLSYVSSHALMPGDGPAETRTREPYFEAIATVQQPFVLAYGERVALRPGMSLKADILLERRSLVQWLLEPLLVMKGRSL